LEFTIRSGQVGDETRLSLLGRATFLQTYAGSADEADLLAFIETEHSAEGYKFWLESDFANVWIAENRGRRFRDRLRGGLGLPIFRRWGRDRDQKTLCPAPVSPTRPGMSFDE
jgi:hypothetical protein